MAGEAVVMIETNLPIPMTCANGTGIEKGSVLVLSDPFTVAACTTGTVNQKFGGIAAEEKIASDGLVKVAVYREGIFKVTISGNVTVGEGLVLDGVATAGTATNKFSVGATNAENVAGIALETGTDGQTILMEVRPTSMQLV
tara:strand:+ start:3358 stop:3783 length:426 start_codon:yes stop_codon:yes gene_type:complete